ncbi:outer membrane beta-barrel protein [Cesiribacter sp. SM1]|uniref:outer membrane beta-barrel protein n=1 Tax=Cesiribacter sp. SM1 TaxID=2861196 RepID=UPI001CD45E1E|nr:outer membrane beta-barrel protein [Cesiribacter sp. SM1]
MKIFIPFVLLLFSTQVLAQQDQHKFDIRFGVGKSLLGSGDIITTTFENELNYRLNPYFATAFSLNYGKSSREEFDLAVFTQGNLNLYLSPFRNTRRNDFRIGAGFTYYKITDGINQGIYRDNRGNVVLQDFLVETRTSFGYNIILENTYTIKNRFLLGLKLFTQPYSNGDINSGLMLKIGYKL